MRYLPLLAALLPTAAIAESAPIPPSNMPVLSRPADASKCVAPRSLRIGNRPAPQLRKLGEMPDAKPIYTVLNEVDGCPKPVSVKRG